MGLAVPPVAAQLLETPNPVMADDASSPEVVKAPRLMRLDKQ